MPAPQQRANVAGMVSCLGMAWLNVQPPGSVKAAPSPLPTASVPPCCLHVQEHIGPYPARLGHNTSLRLNGAPFPFWFNRISNLGSDLNGSIAHMGWLQLPSCCPKLKQGPVICCWGRNASVLPVVLLGIPSWTAIAQNPSLQSPEPGAWLGGGDLSCWPLAGGLQPYRAVLLSHLLLQPFLPAGLCLVLHRTGLSCSEQLREGGFRLGPRNAETCQSAAWEKIKA